MATARGWQKAPFQAAQQGVVQHKYEYSLTASPKSSPDRRQKTILNMTIDGEEDAWLHVVFSDKAGGIVHRSSPIPTDESQRTFNAAKRSMRWLDDRTVVVELAGTHRPGSTQSPSDLSFPAEELKSWEDYLILAGYHEGLAVPLFVPEGRHVGFVALLSGTGSRRRGSCAVS